MSKQLNSLSLPASRITHADAGRVRARLLTKQHPTLGEQDVNTLLYALDETFPARQHPSAQVVRRKQPCRRPRHRAAQTATS